MEGLPSNPRVQDSTTGSGRRTPPILPAPSALPPKGTTSLPSCTTSLLPDKRSSAMNKKTKYGTACIVCKEDHKACDGGRPCSRCISLGIAGSCQSSRSSKEEIDFSGNLVFCLEEISIESTPSQPAVSSRCSSVPGCASWAPTRQRAPPTQKHNFHYAKIPTQNNTVVSVPSRPASKKAKLIPSPPTPTTTAKATTARQHEPQPSRNAQQPSTTLQSRKAPSPVKTVGYRVEESTRKVEVSSSSVSTQQVDSQLLLLQRQLEIEKEKQNKLKLKLQLRRELYEQEQIRPSVSPIPYPPFQELPPQQQQQNQQQQMQHYQLQGQYYAPVQHFQSLPPQQQLPPQQPVYQVVEIELLQPLHETNRKRKHSSLYKSRDNFVDGYLIPQYCGDESNSEDPDNTLTEAGLRSHGWGWDCPQAPFEVSPSRDQLFSPTWCQTPFTIADF